MYRIIPQYLLNGTIFGGGGEMLQNIKRVFGFLYNICLKHFSFWE
jgi:hypothetical protein